LEVENEKDQWLDFQTNLTFETHPSNIKDIVAKVDPFHSYNLNYHLGFFLHSICIYILALDIIKEKLYSNMHMEKPFPNVDFLLPPSIKISLSMESFDYKTNKNSCL
jgi:hypothetical protein